MSNGDRVGCSFSLGMLDDNKLSGRVLWPGASVDAARQPDGLARLGVRQHGAVGRGHADEFAWTRGPITSEVIEVNPSIPPFRSPTRRRHPDVRDRSEQPEPRRARRHRFAFRSPASGAAVLPISSSRRGSRYPRHHAASDSAPRPRLTDAGRDKSRVQTWSALELIILASAALLGGARGVFGSWVAVRAVLVKNELESLVPVVAELEDAASAQGCDADVTDRADGVGRRRERFVAHRGPDLENCLKVGALPWGSNLSAVRTVSGAADRRRGGCPSPRSSRC